MLSSEKVIHSTNTVKMAKKYSFFSSAILYFDYYLFIPVYSFWSGVRWWLTDAFGETEQIGNSENWMPFEIVRTLPV